jgi:hypothetical protein
LDSLGLSAAVGRVLSAKSASSPPPNRNILCDASRGGMGCLGFGDISSLLVFIGYLNTNTSITTDFLLSLLWFENAVDFL